VSTGAGDNTSSDDHGERAEGGERCPDAAQRAVPGSISADIPRREETAEELLGPRVGRCIWHLLRRPLLDDYPILHESTRSAASRAKCTSPINSGSSAGRFWSLATRDASRWSRPSRGWRTGN